MKVAKLKKFHATISFSIEGIEVQDAKFSETEKEELLSFITEALESWGGQRHLDDWLFSSLENVQVTLGRSS